MFDTGSYADVAYTYDEESRQVSRIQPTLPTAGLGFRSGVTQSLMLFPGETTPRVGEASRQLFTDMPDISGGIVMSSEAGYHPQIVKGKQFIATLAKEWEKTGRGGEVTWGKGRY